MLLKNKHLSFELYFRIIGQIKIEYEKLIWYGHAMKNLNWRKLFQPNYKLLKKPQHKAEFN